VWLLTTATASLGLLLYLWVLLRLGGISGMHIPFALLLVALFAAAEIFVVHFEFRRDSHTFSLVEVPLVLGLLFAQPALIVPAHLLGAALALALYRKQGPTKLMFNLAAFTLEDSVAVIIFHTLAGTSSVKAFGTEAGAGAAAGLASIIGIVAVFGAIALSGGRLTRAERRQAVGFGLLATAMTTSVTVTVAVLAALDPAAAWLPLVPVAGIYLAQRVYVAERHERLRLEFLHQSTGLLNERHDIDWAVDSLLNQARQTFGGDIAALTYLPAGDRESLALTVVGPGDEHQSQTSIPRSALLDTWARTAGGEGRTITDLRGDIEVLIPGVVIRDALVIPLQGENQVIGYLLVANRLSPVSRFTEDDLKVFQTLGHHVSVALENGQLEQSIQQVRVLERQVVYRATHDPLTGLGNRTLMEDSLRGRVGGATEPGRVSVIVVAVTAGVGTTGETAAAAGTAAVPAAAVADKVRMVGAQRLRRCLRDHDLVARLGPDTFAVIADTSGGAGGGSANGGPACNGGSGLCQPGGGIAIALAERMMAILSARITIDTMTIPTAVSIGVAVSDGAADAETLLAQGLTALDQARTAGGGAVAVFRDIDSRDIDSRAGDKISPIP